MPYLGSSDLLTSVANQELIPAKPAEWTHGYRLKKFSFINQQDCHVRIDGQPSSIFLKANQGISLEREDDDISSFVIVESGIVFNWIGLY